MLLDYPQRLPKVLCSCCNPQVSFGFDLQQMLMVLWVTSEQAGIPLFPDLSSYQHKEYIRACWKLKPCACLSWVTSEQAAIPLFYLHKECIRAFPNTCRKLKPYVSPVILNGVVPPNRLPNLRGECARDEQITEVACCGSYKAVAPSSLCSSEASLKGKPEKQLNL